MTTFFSQTQSSIDYDWSVACAMIAKKIPVDEFFLELLGCRLDDRKKTSAIVKYLTEREREMGTGLSP